MASRKYQMIIWVAVHPPKDLWAFDWFYGNLLISLINIRKQTDNHIKMSKTYEIHLSHSNVTPLTRHPSGCKGASAMTHDAARYHKGHRHTWVDFLIMVKK